MSCTSREDVIVPASRARTSTTLRQKPGGTSLWVRMDSWGAAKRSIAMTEKRWGMPKPKVKKSRPVVNKMGARRHCRATKNTGLPCTAVVKHGNNFCGTHQPKVPKAGPICQATIASSGEPCPAQSKWGSRWCGKHFAKWHASP